MITFRLNNHSGVPPYLQIVQQVKQALRMGILKEGDKLPTVKEVVAMITINPNTVFKAYKELESMGLVEGRTGSGTYVLQQPAGPLVSVHATLADELSRWVRKAREAGLDDESIEALVQATLHETKEEEVEPRNVN